jgi:hypothetical protein
MSSIQQTTPAPPVKAAGVPLSNLNFEEGKAKFETGYGYSLTENQQPSSFTNYKFEDSIKSSNTIQSEKIFGDEKHIIKGISQKSIPDREINEVVTSCQKGTDLVVAISKEPKAYQYQLSSYKISK